MKKGIGLAVLSIVCFIAGYVLIAMSASEEAKILKSYFECMGTIISLAGFPAGFFAVISFLGGFE